MILRAGNNGPVAGWIAVSPPLDFGIVPVSPGFSAMGFAVPGLELGDLTLANPIDAPAGFTQFGAVLPIQISLVFAPGLAVVALYNTTPLPVSVVGEPLIYEALVLKSANLLQ